MPYPGLVYLFARSLLDSMVTRQPADALIHAMPAILSRITALRDALQFAPPTPTIMPTPRIKYV